MRLRSIIIDDEESGMETLNLLIEKHVNEDLKVIAKTTSAKDAIEMIENYLPEIVFLDISMPEMDGFEMLEKLSWKNFHLVFATAHQNYGLKALKINAIDYLLKPIDPKDLKFAVEKIKKTIAEKTENADTNYTLSNNSLFKPNKLGVTTKHGIEYIDPLEIIYLESRSNYTLIYLNGTKEEILTPKTLKEFESQLCDIDSNFIRVHHSFIINLHKVLRYLKNDDNIIMANDQTVPLAKSRKDLFYKWLGV